MNLFDIAVARKLYGGSGGGGDKKELVPRIAEQEFTATDEVEEGMYAALLEGSPFYDSTIVVTYDGTDYTLEELGYDESISYYGEFDDNMWPVFDTIPFAIFCPKLEGIVQIVCDNANTHTISISAISSGGGSSDYTTAKVTIRNDTSTNLKIVGPFLTDDPNYTGINTLPDLQSVVQPEATIEGDIVLYKGNSIVEVIGQIDNRDMIDPYPDFYFDAKGNAVFDFPILIVTGDCELQISYNSPD